MNTPWSRVGGVESLATVVHCLVAPHTRLWRAAAIGQSDPFFRIATRLVQLSHKGWLSTVCEACKEVPQVLCIRLGTYGAGMAESKAHNSFHGAFKGDCTPQ